jgi:hypothetical protein
MFVPPEHFHQLRALLWAGPGTAGLAAWGVAYTLGVPVGPAWVIAGVMVLLVAAASVAAVWVSVFGTRHALWGVAAAHGLVALPLAVLLLPAVWPAGQVSVGVPLAALVVAAAHTALLFAATAWRIRRQGPLPGTQAGASRGQRWAGLRLYPERGTWQEEGAASGQQTPPGGLPRAVGPAAMGLLSVGAFGALRMWLQPDALATAAFVLGNALCLWLSLWLLSRALARAWALRGWELRSGARLAHPRALAFTAERERSPVGRWLRRRLAAPAAQQPGR